MIAIVQIVWSTLLAAHLAAAVVWLWSMPGGFPSNATEFWINQVAPWAAIGWAGATLLAPSLRGAALVPGLRLGVAAFWVAFGASARVHFLVSSGSLWSVAFMAGMTLVLLWAREHGRRAEGRWLVPIFLVPALWAGWRAPTTQRAPDASTTPAATSLPTVPPAPPGTAELKLLRLTKDAQLRTAEGRLVVRRGELVLTAQPLLSFEARSPDRSLVSLAPPELRRPSSHELVATSRDGARFWMRYRDEPAVLEVSTRGAAIDLDAHTQLAADVYTSDNTYAELTLRGHKRLSLRFSPMPSLRVDVPAFSEPARFGYLDAAGLFHVAEARRLDKGPFVELGAGKLGPKEPLVIQLFDGDTLVFEVRLDDWARQISTARSPAAGWGVPVNVVRFMRGAAAPDAPALISLSLASTSLGHGTQTVGHAAGVYRNRMHVEPR